MRNEIFIQNNVAKLNFKIWFDLDENLKIFLNFNSVLRFI